jgi:hypothetical protein
VNRKKGEGQTNLGFLAVSVTSILLRVEGRQSVGKLEGPLLPAPVGLWGDDGNFDFGVLIFSLEPNPLKLTLIFLHLSLIKFTTKNEVFDLKHNN